MELTELPEVSAQLLGGVWAHTSALGFTLTTLSISGSLLGPTFPATACLAHFPLESTCFSVFVDFASFSSNSFHAGNGPNTWTAVPEEVPKEAGRLEDRFGRPLLQEKGVLLFHAKLHLLMGPFIQSLVLRRQNLCLPLQVPSRSQPDLLDFGWAVRQTNGRCFSNMVRKGRIRTKGVLELEGLPYEFLWFPGNPQPATLVPVLDQPVPPL